MNAAKTADQLPVPNKKRFFFRFVSTFWFFMLFFGFIRFFGLRNSSKASCIRASPMLECNFIQIFSGSEPAGVKKAFVYIRMNSSTGSSGAMKDAKTADQQSRAEQKAIFFGLFLLFFGLFRLFFGFLYFFRFFSLFSS